ncbi:MAG: RNA chaperone Hfq [Armatimonadetes bacterium]|nr:RNA chaperone Hfq [Armatimonadota bacterium]
MNGLRGKTIKVVFLNGESMTGKLHSFSTFVLVVGNSLLYKHAIAEITPVGAEFRQARETAR